jgi:hypothetical protein
VALVAEIGRADVIAVLVLDLQRVALPDRLSQLVDELEDGKGLLRRPVGRNLQSNGERQAPQWIWS